MLEFEMFALREFYWEHLISYDPPGFFSPLLPGFAIERFT
jgi:hypothetical protein